MFCTPNKASQPHSLDTARIYTIKQTETSQIISEHEEYAAHKINSSSTETL
jgi:hypothetical protein